MSTLETLECISESNGKLRMRITSNGYFNDANCQCSRDIRIPGAKYTIPRENITLRTSKNGKYYYHLGKNIERITEINMTVFSEPDPDCVICGECERQVVYAPCGHYNSCRDCATKWKNQSGTCPMCRTKLTSLVDINSIQ